MSGILDAIEPSSLAREELAQRWSDVVNDPVLRNLPYRIELNKWGHIEMTPPASPMHMRLATRLAAILEKMLGGEAFTECAIATTGGVKVADVAWCSPSFLERLKASFSNWDASLSEAPELCVEVMSPSNVAGELKEKCGLYLEAGARETWILHPDLTIEIRDTRGPQQKSSLGVDIAGLRKELGAMS
jgi:Uma2 family endonuclease